MLLEDFCKKIDAVPMSVIEDIKAEIPILSHWQTDDGQDLLMVADALECIDRHTGKERMNDQRRINIRTQCLRLYVAQWLHLVRKGRID